MHIWYSGRMHTAPVGVTFNFSLLHFKNYIYTTFVIVCLVHYTYKHADYKLCKPFINKNTYTKNIFVKNCKIQE